MPTTLVFNCGSSSLKFAVYRRRSAEAGSAIPLELVLRGRIAPIGSPGRVRLERPGHEPIEGAADVADHGEAVRFAVGRMTELRALDDGPEGIGHRIVHGGRDLTGPVVLDTAVLAAIEAASELAPLHNGAALAGIRSAGELFGPDVRQVAVFDTAFHHGLPDVAARYAIPTDLAERHGIRRYGFHGLAHEAMSRRAAELLGRPLGRTRTITLQLGQGCSACAVDGGRSVETSMGFSPLEGLMMGTRSGDVDPAVVGYLSRKEGVSAAEVVSWLNTRSGLLGVSGTSPDMQGLVEREAAGDGRAALAVEMFCYRVRKTIGTYLAVLGGADAVVFGGGIGERAPEVRRRAVAGMAWCGLVLDEAKNAAAVGREGPIGRDDAAVKAFVVPVDEERLIAEGTARALAR